MGVIAWLVLGALSGWIANRLMDSRTGNLHSIFVSVVGACILLWIINKIRR